MIDTKSYDIEPFYMCKIGVLIINIYIPVYFLI